MTSHSRSMWLMRFISVIPGYTSINTMSVNQTEQHQLLLVHSVSYGACDVMCRPPSPANANEDVGQATSGIKILVPEQPGGKAASPACAGANT